MLLSSGSSLRKDLLLLFCSVMALFCVGLGAHPYLIPSEARYIEIPRQMLATGDWLTPRINGVPYFEKPPLFYWLQACVMGMFGMEEWAGRIVTAILVTCTCLITYLMGRSLFGRSVGICAALILSTSLMGYGLAHVAMLDVPVSLFITACLASFLAAQRDRRWYYAMYAASALAMMSKGLIGIVIPGMVIGAWIVLTRQWKILAQAKLLPGILIFLMIAAPWHVLMAMKHPDFLSFYFIHEHFTRYLTDEHKRTAPWWFFIAITPLGLLPWTALLPGALRRLERKNSIDVFLLLWIALPLMFFSASHSKLISYIFPIFPPLAIVLGRKLADFWHGNLPVKSLRIDALVVMALIATALVATQFLPMLPGKSGHKLAALTAISPWALAPVAATLVWLGFIIMSKRAAPSLIAGLALLGAALGLTANYAVAPLDTATTKPIASQLRERLTEGDMVVAYGTYWQDLPVYLNRNITVVDWAGELNFGVTHYPQTQEWMIHADTFWQRCAAHPHTVYVFINEEGFKSLPQHEDCPLHIVAQSGKTLLLEKSARKD